MRFYIKYILLGILIGIAILGLLSLAGCEDTEAQAQARYQAHQMHELTMEVASNEAALLLVEKEIKLQNMADILRRLNSLELADAYLADIDPNAPINAHLLKLSDSWAKEYGTSHESVLKYNTVAAWAFAQKALQQIEALEKRVAAMETTNQLGVKAWVLPTADDVVDPNEVKLPDDLVVRPNEVKE